MADEVTLPDQAIADLRRQAAAKELGIRCRSVLDRHESHRSTDVFVECIVHSLTECCESAVSEILAIWMLTTAASGRILHPVR
jgi:hypothetical protein